ncbi:alpha/beta hydrolase family protein [Emydomyces testavorans]|uniref:Alpha/beta hydrolase family protein n=1 Tax=Emydomyces testavorans TaxID=2070801 RepID=A0AAF0IGZ1_9EURO|nr:alpha/beta hydrolase family protein [Emydomyces testavorans]
MASDVEHFIHENGLEKPVLLGHSMPGEDFVLQQASRPIANSGGKRGAKTAMTVALRQPSLLAGLISVDNVPVRVPLSKDFAKYIQGMNEVEKAKVTKQKEADDILQRYEDSLPIRQFLLTNLIRSKDDNTLKFRIPLHVLRDRLEHMADFPFVPEQHAVKFEGPALFVRGTQSPYVPDSSLEVVKSFFPAFELEDIDAGHWVISENPEAFKNGSLPLFYSAWLDENVANGAKLWSTFLGHCPRIPARDVLNL